MSDVKLFRTTNNKGEEMQGRSATLEKSLQTQIERHMEEFLGVRFLASDAVPVMRCLVLNCACMRRYDEH